ncbi:hypothetical protein BKN38_06260 [Helicobacter sp. CLO-3]|uniref:hypothetical protein n=1 Tax=unclassified Helicobacter TaxID=2593540 RepID=UPI000805DDB9|nr:MULTISPECIES: hypothetical protein [unclassified Helicobacter]OBV29933.1 hypothetical protein BA723_03680 [Helicobacter sp. CLO-3]OHU82806.1 hypothetical protein BKN38_06260 [Helicobacter sp. CLO-3]
MKSLVSKFAILACAAVLFAACGDDKKEAAPAATESTQEQAATPSEAPAEANAEVKEEAK